MKKFTVAILAILYIGTSTGATLHMHYCMGKLAGWGLGHDQSKTCGKCGMEKSDGSNNGCCKDEHKFIKNVTDQKTTEIILQVLQMPVMALPVSIIDFTCHNYSSVTEENPTSHAPPRSYGVAVYIRNCFFLI